MELLAAVVLFLASGDGDVARREAQATHIAEKLIASSSSAAANVSAKRRWQRAHPDLALVRADVHPERRLSSW